MKMKRNETGRQKDEWIEAWPESSLTGWNVTLEREGEEGKLLRTYDDEDVDDPKWSAWRRARDVAKKWGLVAMLRDQAGSVVDEISYEPEASDE